ncbi:MAG TPA: DUF4157 domain-containing protein, partial [Acidimicrobiales bacterium]|nr:DUF4157 domain-containing protein [Acidimicrobiales bacterium]
MRAAVKDKQQDVSVEHVAEQVGAVDVAAENSPAELDAEARAEAAMAVQRDWSPDAMGVKVHDDQVAREAADSIGAVAFTKGDEIYLGSK